MSSSSWLDQLEARLDQQLEAFLAANPSQEALLQLADEIRRWQERVVKAQAAGATALAERAKTHQQGLMEQGRQRWQQLGELGVSFAAVERDLRELDSRSRPPRTSSLEQDWAAFEADQALEELRRQQR